MGGGAGSRNGSCAGGIGVGSFGSGISHPLGTTTRRHSGKFHGDRTGPTMVRLALILLALIAASQARANDLGKDLAPTGTLRATYIATNPVQAFIDPATKEVRGPAAALAREL